MNKYISKLSKIVGAYFQDFRNQYARFKKGMKTVGVTGAVTCKHPKGGVDVIMSKFNTP